MTSDEGLDRMLRQAMATSPSPTLSARFDERLSARLSARRLSGRRRAGLTAYALGAGAISVGLMRWAAIDWPVMLAAVAAPVAVATLACRRCLTLAWRSISAV
jgi:hypothetical protein